jgi:hypothetical protein
MQRKGTTFCGNFALPAPYYRGFRGSLLKHFDNALSRFFFEVNSIVKYFISFKKNTLFFITI